MDKVLKTYITYWSKADNIYPSMFNIIHEDSTLLSCIEDETITQFNITHGISSKFSLANDARHEVVMYVIGKCLNQ